MDKVIMHSFRVALLAIEFGNYIGLSKEDINRLCTASLLHDYGKNYITDSVLYKPGNLTDDEYNTIKSHPKIAYKQLQDNNFKDLTVLRIIVEHHERVDGKGYPNNLNDGDIYYLSKILSLCDSYDAMRSSRSYKKGYSSNDSLEEIRKNLNTQFSEYYGRKFISYIESREKVKIPYEMYNVQ